MLHDFSSLQNKGSSPLYQAAARGHEAVVKVLLDSGSNVNQADLEGTPPLYIAAERGHEAVVKVLLSNGANVHQADKEGDFPLSGAAYWGHVAVVTLLLKNGADVNQRDSKGKSSLHDAALRGHEDIVKVLLSNGANVNQVNNDRKKPIDVAKTQKIKDILYAHMKKKLQEEQQPVDESLWFQAAQQGDLALIQQGINDKIDVNCRDSESRTAVWWAAEKGHLQLVEYFIAQHADLSIADVSAYEVFLSTPTPLTSTLIPYVA